MLSHIPNSFAFNHHEDLAEPKTAGQRRFAALQLAIKKHSDGLEPSTADDVVNTAQKFYDFLAGDTDAS